MGSSESGKQGSSNDAPPSRDRTPPVKGPGARGFFCGECGGDVSKLNLFPFYKTCSLCKTKRTMHPACFNRQLANSRIDKTTTAEAWEADKNITLWCAGCMVPCFICSKIIKKGKKRATKHNFSNACAERVLCSGCGLKWCVMLNSRSAPQNTKFKNFCGHVTENHSYKCDDCEKDNTIPAPTTLDIAKQTKKCHDNVLRPFFVQEGTQLPDNVNHTLSNVYQDDTTVVYENCVHKPEPIEMDKCDCDEKAGTSAHCSNTHCLNYMLYYECTDDCPLGHKCLNQRIRKHVFKNLIVYDSPSAKGLAVMNKEVINEDEFICEYTGVVIDPSAVMGSQTSSFSSYCIGNKDIMIDAKEVGSVARYINHSCDPNCVVVPWVVDGYYRLGIFAKRYINRREELTIDYKWEAKPGEEKVNCLCGANNCRNTIHSYNKHDLGWIFMDKNGQWHQKREAPDQPGFWQLAGNEKTEPEDESFSQDDNEWMKDVEPIVNRLNSEFDAAIEGEDVLSDYLLSVIDVLRKNIKMCKGRSKKAVYKFMTDLSFVPIQNVDGYEGVEEEGSLVHKLTKFRVFRDHVLASHFLVLWSFTVLTVHLVA